MVIDFLCPSGSPIGITPIDIENRGVGGAELALMTLAEVLMERGHTVTVFNSPRKEGLYGGMEGLYSGVQYRAVSAFDPNAERDAVVLFRCPDKRFRSAKGRRVFWSCDQFTTGNYATDIFPVAERVVCISPHHADDFVRRYAIAQERLTVITLGVRTWEYSMGVPKVKGQCIYCSVPDRGLHILRNVWDRIVKEVPWASLVITFDYRMWGTPDEGITPHRLEWVGAPNVKYLARVPRSELVRLQCESDLQPYPCIYDELFCIAVAECQVAGAVPITSSMGALPTTNLYGKRLEGDPRSGAWQTRFVEEVINTLLTPETLKIRQSLCMASRRAAFNWDILAVPWEGVLS